MIIFVEKRDLYIELLQMVFPARQPNTTNLPTN